MAELSIDTFTVGDEALDISCAELEADHPLMLCRKRHMGETASPGSFIACSSEAWAAPVI